MRPFRFLLRRIFRIATLLAPAGAVFATSSLPRSTPAAQGVSSVAIESFL